MASLRAASRQLCLTASAPRPPTNCPHSGGLRACRHALHSRRLSRRWHASAAVDERGSSGARQSAADATGNIVPAPLLSQVAPLSSTAVNASAVRCENGQAVVAASASALAPPLPSAAAPAAVLPAADELLGEDLEGGHLEHGMGWRSLDDIAVVHEIIENEMVNINENVNQVGGMPPCRSQALGQLRRLLLCHK